MITLLPFLNRIPRSFIRGISGALFASATLWSFASGCIYRIPASNLTVTRMHVLERRLLDYVRLNHELPTALSQLPKVPGYDNSTLDGWGRLIILERDSARTIRLRSYGKDGDPGGFEDDGDIVHEFMLPEDH